MTNNEVLLDYLFDAQSQPLRPTFARWLETSRRYADFVASNRDKIRKKLRVTHDADALEDLRWELEVAYLLRLDKRFTVAYEPYTAGQPFGPDYAVTFTTSITFNVEVTRMRVASDDSAENVRRIVDTVFGKLTQLMPNTSNIIVVGSACAVDEIEFADEMKVAKRRVEASDSAHLARYGFRERATFFKYFDRLNLVVSRPAELQTATCPTTLFWGNTTVPMALPNKALTALRQCFA